MKRSISPLRYPGGKAKLYNKIVNILQENNLIGKTYIEPFAGGAGLAMLLLKNNMVDSIILNDFDRSIYAFWYSILNHTEIFCEMIKNIEINIEKREEQKIIQSNKNNVSLLKLGFSTFYLNRVNHSGIIKGGPIGGIKQLGNYKINCRFNKVKLIEQIKEIASYKNKINIYNLDCLEFIDSVLPLYPKDSFVFFDPPYYKKGPDLYVNFYKHKDHELLSRAIKTKVKQNWIITYDNVNKIREIYKGVNQIEFNLTYSLKNKGKNSGSEILIFKDNLEIKFDQK